MLSHVDRQSDQVTGHEGQDFSRVAADFANGSIGRQLGLTPDALAIGLDIAYQAMSKGDLVGASQIYSSLLVCYPLNVEFNLGMANCALRIGRADVALNCASVAIGCANDDPRGYLLAAKSLLALNQTEAAIADARKALQTLDTCRLEDELADFIEDEARRLLVALRAE